MEPLERRYRRLLRLLPADHRAARGEELLGLLLDLDEGRARPSVRQAAGLVGLAARLRLVRAGSLLLAAFLIAQPSELVALAYRVTTGQVTVQSASPLTNVYALLLVPALLWLATAAAWVHGSRRAALAVFVTYLAVQLYATGGVRQEDLVAVLALGIATFGRWPAPRARLVMLGTIPLAMLLWLLAAMVSVQGTPSAAGLLGITLIVASIGALPAAARFADRLPRPVRDRPSRSH